MKLLKRAFTILALFALTGVGATFAADGQSENIQNFFLGNAPVTSSDLNPVLVLLAGPAGPPGPAGVAGKDGFVGLNGLDGEDGIDGAPGATGPQGEPGASVVVVALQVGDTDCPIGGSKLVASDGTESFICNGRPGQPGPTGATGATGAKGDAGTPGTGGAGNGTRFGVGSLGIGACDDDVEVELKNQFAGGQFKMNQVVISGISDACDTYTLKVWLTVRGAGALYGTGSVIGANYAFTSGDEIRCEKIVSNASWTGSLNDRSVSIDATHICTNMTATRTVAPRLNSISARDLDDYVGFEIG